MNKWDLVDDDRRDAMKRELERALVRFRESHPLLTDPVLAVAGGVAANAAIRAELDKATAHNGVRLVTPPLALCTDNAAMIAYVGLERLEAGQSDPLDAPVRPRWPLDEISAPRIGSGRRGAKA